MSLLKVWWPYATLFVHLVFFLQYIHSYNCLFITFTEGHLHIFTAAGSMGGTSMVAEPRIELRPALQQASALPSELRCTLVSYAALLYWFLLCPRTGKC